jgi:preprotein translocase subunit SecE
MAIKEDVKRERAERNAPAPTGDAPRSDAPPEQPDAPDTSAADAQRAEQDDEIHDVAAVGESLGDGDVSPTQLGTKRFVYAAYFAGAVAIAFLMSKVIGFAWLKLQSYKPAIGEPRDEVVMPLAGLIGALVAAYYWYRSRARELAEEVAAEMSKVTWPSRTEVTNGTFVVIVTTVVSTVFFALMDKFWGFITNLVYGGS